MKPEWKPRLRYLDANTAIMALEQRREDVPDLLALIAAEPTTLLQTRYSSLAGDYEAIAWFSYGLGLPLGEVRQSFANASRALLMVFQLRGTEPVFPAYTLAYDPNRMPEARADANEVQKSWEDQQIDFSLTNSRRGHIAVCEALISGEESIARELASLIWDPPNATYIGPNSFCTPNDQHLAYALRELLHGTTASLEKELGKVKSVGSEDCSSHHAAMIRGVATADRDQFTAGLSSLLAWHEKEASAKKNRRNSEFFICTVGLGLCVLAVERGVCTLKGLPQDNVFLPLRMISKL